MTYELHHGDCLEVLRGMPGNSVDSIVTDPPYGLSFMGKKWDYDVPSVAIWAECLRVLKPGGYLLAFAGTRTQHRMAVRIEDAGFEIRDMIAWVYGSGFPKSHNGEWGGTALKPALEPITMARKPLTGTVADNWGEHGTGALNIDGCRVSATGDKLGGGRVSTTAEGWDRPWKHDEKSVAECRARGDAAVAKAETLGRWPANLIHDGSDEVLAAFPDAKGQQGDVSDTAPSAKTSNVYGAMKRVGEPSQDSDNDGAVGFKMKPGARRLDSGSAARFFYCAKASKKDRDEGLDGFERSVINVTEGHGRGAINTSKSGDGIRVNHPRANTHPTVKPTDLMAYLCRLVTPPGGVVLDPFMGSGSTGKAAVREGFRFIGCDLSADYVAISRARIEHALVLSASGSQVLRPASARDAHTVDLFGEVA